jgi:hypothetical protein
LNRIRSGVLVPLLLPPFDPGRLSVLEDLGTATVVMRCAFVVSALGGGGKELRSGREGRTDARQRKHSPLPKKCEDGCGGSLR